MMKHRYFILVFIFFLCAGKSMAQANNNGNNNSIADYNGAQLANKLAKKMKDTLDLSSQQRQQIKTINLQLHNQKMALRNQYTGQDSVLRVKTQQVENTRDSLYKPILGAQKYTLYRQKKINLLRMN